MKKKSGPKFHGPPCDLGPNDPMELNQEVKRRPKKKVGGLDGWRTVEAQSLPTIFFIWLAKFFDAIEAKMPWPTAWTTIYNPGLRKDDSRDPMSIRFLGILSLFISAWTKTRRRHLHQYRTRFQAPEMKGMCVGSSINDVSYPAQAILEAMQWLKGTITVMLDDRTK